MKFNYKEFKIGDFVKVSRLVRRCSDGDGFCTVMARDLPDGKKELSDGKKTRVGVVTGIKYMVLGQTSHDYDCGCSFNKTGSLTVWRIRFGLAGTELCALPEDLLKCEEPKKFPISSERWSKVSREGMRKDMKDEPRDAKGRWTGEL